MNLIKPFSKNRRGIGLLELLLAFTIITILLTMAIRYYSTTKNAQLVSSLKEQKEYINSAMARWYDITKATSLTALVPKDLKGYISDQDLDTTIPADQGSFKLLDTHVNLHKTAASGDTFTVEAFINNDIAQNKIDISICNNLGIAYVGSATSTAAPGCVPDGTDTTKGTFTYTFDRNIKN